MSAISGHATDLATARASGQPTSRPRACIFTGGSRGIGAAICAALASSGTHVCVNYTSAGSAPLAQAVVEKAISMGVRACAVRADVSKADQVTRLFEEAERELRSPVTALVNNAAILGPRAGLLDTSLEDLQRVIAINVHGPFLCTQEFLRRVIARDNGGGGEGRGAIVNVSSGSAFIGHPLAYAMTKGALNSFSAGCVAELAANGIRLNSVSPGLTKTEMVTDEVIAQNMGTIPMSRAAEPKEIADVVAFLLSDAASYVSGGNLRVAGGRRMGSGAQ